MLRSGGRGVYGWGMSSQSIVVEIRHLEWMVDKFKEYVEAGAFGVEERTEIVMSISEDQDPEYQVLEVSLAHGSRLVLYQMAGEEGPDTPVISSMIVYREWLQENAPKV